MNATASARTAAALAALLLLPASPPAVAQEEETPVFVRSLDFEGVERVSERELAAALLTSGPSWRPWARPPEFDAGALEEDLERVAGFYREHGYYQTQARYELEWNPDRSRVRIRIFVEEGPPVHLVAFRLVQREPARLGKRDWGRVISDLPLQVGQVFGTGDYRKVRRELTDRLAELGRPQPVIDGGAEVDVDAGEARVDWSVDPGPEVRFGEVRVQGLERVEEEVVRAELAFASGDRFDVSSRQRSRERLIALGLFRSVVVESVPPEPEEPEREGPDDALDEPAADSPEGVPEPPEPRVETAVWPVTVRVQERLPRTVRVGVGYGTEELYRARIEWRQRNFFGRARLLDMRLQYNDLTPGFDVRLTQPHFLRHGIRLRAETAIRYETMPAYEAVRFANAIQLERDLSELWAVHGGYGFDIADVDHEDPDASDGIDRVSAVRIGFERDARDDRKDPRRGTWLRLFAEPAFEAIGSTGSWVHLGAEGRGFLPVAFATLALRARVAGIDSFADSGYSDVPVFKRLFSGGSTSVRGFKFQEVGPLDEDGDPVGGRSLLEGSVELRFPIWARLRGVGFLDAGFVDRRSFHYRLDDVRESAGGGLRLVTPVGSIRFDVGFPLDREDGEDSYRIHLAVGHFF